jgi:hypothetical protein
LGNGGCSISFYGFTISFNLRNQFNVSMEYGWNKNLEGEVMKDIYMIICGFWGVNIENDKEDSFDSFNTTAVVGIR